MTLHEKGVIAIDRYLKEYPSEKGKLKSRSEVYEIMSRYCPEISISKNNVPPTDICWNSVNNRPGSKIYDDFEHWPHALVREDNMFQLVGTTCSYSGEVIHAGRHELFGVWEDGLLRREDSNSNAVRYVVVKALVNNKNVWLVKDTKDNRLFVKKISEHGNIEVYKYLLKKPVIGMPKLYSVEQSEDGSICTLEEYISGHSLAEILADTEKELSNSEIVNIALQICKILSDLHNCEPSLIHRDIKPSNIMISDDGKVYLIDLNAAKEVKENTTEDTVFGATRHFASPEQSGFGINAKSSKPTSDIYSLGATLNYILTGNYANNVLAFDPWGTIIRKCMQFNCEDRYQSAEELAAAIIQISMEL